MPTPRKGPRFGRTPRTSASCWRTSPRRLFEAEHITTTEAKAKVLRPYAEHLITKAKKGGVHDRRQVIAKLHDKTVDAQALRRDRAPLRGAYRRVPAHPQAGSPPR